MAEHTRREFLTEVALTGAGLTIVPRHVLGRGLTAPSDTLNIAAVGVGGQGRSDLINLASENIVAICDVDWEYADRGFAGLDTTIKNQQERLDRLQDFAHVSNEDFFVTNIAYATYVMSDLVRAPDDRGLRNVRMIDERAFHFHRADPMACDVEDIIHAAEEPVVAVGVALCAVAGHIHARSPFVPVLTDVAFRIAVNSPEHRWPGTRQGQETTAHFDLLAFLGADFGGNAGKWSRG